MGFQDAVWASQWMGTTLMFLKHYHDEEKDFFEQNCYRGWENSRKKEQYKQWMHSHSLNKPEKFKKKHSSSESVRLLCSGTNKEFCWWNSWNVACITAVSYSVTLPHLKSAVGNKQREMLSSGIVLLLEYAQAYTAAPIKRLVQLWKMSTSEWWLCREVAGSCS